MSAIGTLVLPVTVQKVSMTPRVIRGLSFSWQCCKCQYKLLKCRSGRSSANMIAIIPLVRCLCWITHVGLKILEKHCRACQSHPLFQVNRGWRLVPESAADGVETKCCGQPDAWETDCCALRLCWHVTHRTDIYNFCQFRVSERYFKRFSWKCWSGESKRHIWIISVQIYSRFKCCQ